MPAARLPFLMRGAPVLCMLLAACSGKGEGLDTGETGSPEDTAAELTWFRDNDGDGFGDPGSTVLAEAAPSGFVEDGTDCDDGDPAVFPDALEACNGVDDDCDELVDEDLEVSTWYLDSDGDGFGDETLDACAEPEGYATAGGDCDDEDPGVHPGAAEVCENGVDDDCDGVDPRCRLEGEVSLSDATVKYLGDTTGDLAGNQLACGGDTNGDGWPELLIGESEQFTDDFAGEPDNGGAWLVHDFSEGIHPLDSTGVPIWGDEDGRFRSGAAAFLGDTDGDGYDDLLMGSPHAQEAYLYRGPIDSARGRADADATFTYPPTGAFGLGRAAATLDHGEFVVTGSGNLIQDGRGGRLVGGAFVFDGAASGDMTTDAAIASLTPHISHQYGYFGWSICSGDLNGDGVADLAIGAPLFYSNGGHADFNERGVAYVVYGPFSGDLRMAEEEGELADADARIQGSSTSLGYLGQVLACSGDTDADGVDDLVLTDAASAYLFTSTPVGIVEELDADGTLPGLVASVSLDADLDGDGRQDLLVGVSEEDERGTVHVFYDAFSGFVDRSDADALILGEAEGDYAMIVSGCPDLDGDGIDDLVVGAAGDSTNGARSGAA